MKKVLLGLAVLLLAPGLLLAQGRGNYRAQGYFFVAPGGATAAGSTAGTLSLGGGGEWFVYKGLGLGGELAYLAPTSSFRDGFGALSVNGSYHFENEAQSRKLVPFITAGYTLGVRSGTVNLANFGGGVNYWLRERWGLRFEGRDLVNTTGPTTHFWQLRFAVAFR